MSNSKKEPETLSVMLKSGSDVKSPFEQKRVKEIKQLSSKVCKSGHWIFDFVAFYFSHFDNLPRLLCIIVVFEPRHKKTCLRGFGLSKTQTGLLSYRG